MYRALLVDDEEIILRGLKVIIDWKKFGVEEIYTASSGEQAVELLQNVSVDFMLTDICMINMNGLQLIEKVNQLKRDTRIVVLTGYDNFEYAQQCCKMEVHDFLLKPIEREILENTVRTQLEILQQKRDEKEKKQIEYRAEGLTEQYHQEKFCRELVEGTFNKEKFLNICKKYHQDPDEAVQAIVLLPIIEQEKSWKTEYEYQYLLAKNICISMYDATHQGITFEDSLGRIVVGMFCGKQYDEVEERVHALKVILQEECGQSMRILVGSRVEGLQYLKHSYLDAVAMIPQVKGRSSGVYNTPKAELRLKIFRETVAELQRIMEENINDLQILLKTYDTYVKCTQSYNLSESMMRRTLYQLITMLYYEYCINRTEKEKDYIDRIIDSLSNCSSEEMAVLGRESLLYLFNRGEERVHDVIRTTKEYIERHLGEELTLQILAEQSFISPVYFSRLFKQETGEGCSEYIVKKRMEQAKNLLASTSLRSGEIAFKVGYKDVNYFSAAFKKNVGMSPREYREYMRNVK